MKILLVASEMQMQMQMPEDPPEIQLSSKLPRCENTFFLHIINIWR